MKLVYYRHNFGTPLGVQHGRRLIENNTLGFHRHNTCNGNALFLPSGKEVRGFLLKLPHIHIFEGFIHPAADFGRLYAQIFRTKGHIIFYNSRNQLIIGILKNHAGSLSHIPDVFIVTCIIAVHIDYTLCGQKQAVQVFCQRRLTGAVFSDNCSKAAPFNIKAEFFDGFERAAFIPSCIFKCQVLYGYDIIHLFPFVYILFFYSASVCTRHIKRGKQPLPTLRMI